MSAASVTNMKHAQKSLFSVGFIYASIIYTSLLVVFVAEVLFKFFFYKDW